MRDQNLFTMLESLYQDKQFEEATTIINKNIEREYDLSNMQDAMVLSKLAGYLIDIGDINRNSISICKGLAIFRKNKDDLKKHAKEYSINYNIGNGYSSLYKAYMRSPKYKYQAGKVELLNRAKNHFWKAYRDIGDEDHIFKMKLLINLANVLDQCGRVTEALQYYNEALKINSRFGKATSNRSRSLLWLNSISNTYSLNLLSQAMNGYRIASEDNSNPRWMTEEWSKKADQLEKQLLEL